MSAAGRPPVTVLFLTYEHARFARDAVRSILAQDYEPIEFRISDDASTDGTFAILREEVAAGRQRRDVWLNRNAERIGHFHFSTLLSDAKHDIIVTAHGDDVSEPHRIRRLIEAMLDTGASLVSSDAEMIDADGRSMGLYEGSGHSRWISMRDILGQGWQRTMLGATFAYRKALRTRPVFPSDDPGTPLAFDAVIPIRANLMTGAYFVGEALIRYRRHHGNLGTALVDRTSTPKSLAETAAANRATVLAWILGDIERWIIAQGRTPELSAIEKAFQEAAISQCDTLVDRRVGLWSTGQVMSWISRAELLGRPVRPEFRDDTFSTLPLALPADG